LGVSIAANGWWSFAASLFLWLVSSATQVKAAEAIPGSRVFDETRVAQIRVTVSTNDYLAMQKRIGTGYFSDFPYVPADVQFDDITLTNVAVRIKGHAGSQWPWSLKFDFNLYQPGQ
jgi:hypothetical protein